MAQHDFTQVSQQIASKWEGETDEEHFVRLTSIRVTVSFEEMRNRCCNCENLRQGKCLFYRMEIPNEHKFTPNDCSHHSPDIPF